MARKRKRRKAGASESVIARARRQHSTHDVYIGIDPGQGGAIAVVDGRHVESQKLRVAGDLCADYLRSFEHDRVLCVVENMMFFGSRVRRGNKALKTVVRSYGQILGWLDAFKFDVTTVRAKEWQQQYGLTRIHKDESDADKKNRHKVVAEGLFAEYELATPVFLWNVDAYLLAHYGMHHD